MIISDLNKNIGGLMDLGKKGTDRRICIPLFTPLFICWTRGKTFFRRYKFWRGEKVLIVTVNSSSVVFVVSCYAKYRVNQQVLLGDKKRKGRCSGVYFGKRV